MYLLATLSFVIIMFLLFFLDFIKTGVVDQEEKEKTHQEKEMYVHVL